MEKPLMLSELVSLGQELLEKHGDVAVFQGDMQGVTSSDIVVVNAEDAATYGEKFVHIGEW